MIVERPQNVAAVHSALVAMADVRSPNQPERHK
jgi:hypothetical protein